MDGIHILNIYQMIDKTPYWIAWIVALGAFVSVTIIAFSMNVALEYDGKFEFQNMSIGFIVACVSAVIFLVAGIVTTAARNQDSINAYTVYEILPDNTITANELIDIYDIVDIKGDIFVVRDKVVDGKN